VSPSGNPGARIQLRPITWATLCQREALSRLGRTRLRLELGHAHLLYGKWLRRERRIRDGRDQLRSTYETFDSVGAAAFAAGRASNCGKRRARSQTCRRGA